MNVDDGPACAGGGPLEAELSAYLEGDLEPQRSAAIDTHLAACAGCRGAGAALRALVDRCREAPRPRASDDCVRRAVEAAREALLRTGILRS
jgi:anti-sigma factor RsiW